MEEKKTRGGRRAGAGRPKGDSRLLSFRCPGDLARRLESCPDRASFIRESLESALDSRVEEEQRELRVPSALHSAIQATEVKPLHLPYFDDIRVVAGFPVPLDNDERARDIELLTMLCPHPESSYLIRVEGESMIDAGLMSGDIVIVDKSNRNPSPREIAMCELNGTYTLKRFVLEDGRGWLVPANPDFNRIPVSEGDSFSIWGTVTYIIHKARD